MTSTPGYQGRPARRLQAQVYAEETVCWLCGQWVDQTLPPNHDMARSVDHVIPRSLGGDPYARTNARLAHRLHNSQRGAGPAIQHNPRSVTW